jgi:hypothetical protein
VSYLVCRRIITFTSTSVMTVIMFVHPFLIFITFLLLSRRETYIRGTYVCQEIHLDRARVQLKCDGTRWRTRGEVKGKLANGVGTLHATSEYHHIIIKKKKKKKILLFLLLYGVSSITTADAHTSAASSRLKWRPRRFKWTRPYCRKTKSGFCACTITFQTQYTTCLITWIPRVSMETA